MTAKPSNPIANQTDLQAACSAVTDELARINSFLASKQLQGSVDFLANARVSDVGKYDENLSWIPKKQDIELIKSQLAYIQLLKWFRKTGLFDAVIATQLNKYLFVAAASILESLCHLIHEKYKGPVPEKTVFRTLSMHMKFRNLISDAIETDIAWIWYTRQSIHLFQRCDEAVLYTDSNADKAVETLNDCIEKIKHNLFLLSMNMVPR